MYEISTSVDVGRVLLGPIFEQYLEKLYQMLTHYNKEETIVFFMARGGIGIRLLLEEYLEKNNKCIDMTFKNFYASRLSIAKGCLMRNEDELIYYLVKQFRGCTYREMFQAIFKQSHLLKEKFSCENDIVSKGGLKILLEAVEGQAIKEYFIKQEEYLTEYITQLSEGKKTILLIDTGWLGTSQENLMKAYTEKQWIGIYFGKWDYYDEKPWYFKSMYGLEIDKSIYSKKYPQAGILYYHHIIEAPLEANLSSTEEYRVCDGQVGPNIERIIDENRSLTNPFYRGIVEYIQRDKKKELSVDVKEAYELLVKMIMFPSYKEMKILDVGSRGGDFGKRDDITVIKDTQCSLQSKLYNIQSAIWKQGQMVCEFPKTYRFFQIMYFLKKYNKIIRP